MIIGRTASRVLISVLAGLITLLGTFTMGCDDQGGLSSWERCRSWLGNRMIEWPGGDWSPLWALGLGIIVGVVVWRLLGRTALGRRDSNG